MRSAATDSVAGPPHSGAARATYVLVADGDIVGSASMLKALETMRVGALVARDAVEAMEILERFGPPNLLLISLSLIRGDAFAVMSALRSIAGRKRAAIIALAPVGDLHRISMEARTSLGISSVLPHTVSAAAFRAAVEKALVEAGTPAPTGSTAVAAPPSEQDLIGEFLRDVTSRAARLTGAAGSVVYLQIQDRPRVRAYVDWISEGAAARTPFAVPYAFERVSRTGEVLVIPDLAAQPIFNRQPQVLRDVIGALIAVPLLGGKNRVVGALCVFDVKPLTVTAPQLDALKALGREFGCLLESQASQPSGSAGDVRSGPEPSAPPAATSTVDAATGLLTRESGYAVITHEAARAREDRRPISLVLIAPDSFDDLKVTLGPESSDRLLRTLSQTVKLLLRASDVAIRSGPDEILVVLPTVGASTARDVAERIREAAQKIRARDIPPLTVSGALTELPPGTSPEIAIGKVREQLASARKRGGNRVY